MHGILEDLRVRSRFPPSEFWLTAFGVLELGPASFAIAQRFPLPPLSAYFFQF